MTIAAPLTFHGLRSVRARRDPVHSICLHWTGGAGNLARLYTTLRQTIGPKTPDGLSVHYGIDAQGGIAEFAHPDLVCLHAGIANDTSIGFEVCGPGYPGTSADKVEVSRGIVRARYEDRVRGRRVRMLGYTEAQYATLFAKIDELCERYEIPRRVPTEADGTLMARQMTESEFSRFRGVMGHLHVSAHKNDPGTEPFRRLLDHWRARRSEDDTQRLSVPR